MKVILDYWPILMMAAQLLTCLGVVWFDARADRKIAAAVDPVKADVSALTATVGKLEVRVEDIEGDLDALPTKADLARVEGEVKGAHREAAAAAHGIQRIETMLMERGMERA